MDEKKRGRPQGSTRGRKMISRTVTLPLELIEVLEKEAARERRTLSQLIRIKLEDSMKEDKE